MTVCIVSIRPQPDADLDVAALARRHVPALACPLMTADYISSFPELDVTRYAGVIFTSRHAVTGFMSGKAQSGWQNLPAYCVGRATARSASQAGFTRIETGHGGGRGLVPLIKRDVGLRSGSLLWPSAAEISFDMEAALASDVKVVRHTAYRMEPAGGLAPPVLDALRHSHVGGVIVMSERSARLFNAALEDTGFGSERRNITIIAGSNAIADAAGADWKDCLIARRPTRARLLAIASLLYHRRLT